MQSASFQKNSQVRKKTSPDQNRQKTAKVGNAVAQRNRLSGNFHVVILSNT